MKTKTAYKPDYTWLSMEARPVIRHRYVMAILEIVEQYDNIRITVGSTDLPSRACVAKQSGFYIRDGVRQQVNITCARLRWANLRHARDRTSIVSEHNKRDTALHCCECTSRQIRATAYPHKWAHVIGLFLGRSLTTFAPPRKPHLHSHLQTTR